MARKASIKAVAGGMADLSGVQCCQCLGENPEIARSDDASEGAIFHVLKNDVQMGACLEAT